MTIQFWSNDPTVLFNKEYILELWPTTNMCYEQKLNAITRLVILITILGYISTMSERILLVGGLTLAVVFVLFTMRKQKITKEMLNEGSPMNDPRTKQVIQMLIDMDVDGETMEYILRQVGMEDQMLKQLIGTADDYQINWYTNLRNIAKNN